VGEVPRLAVQGEVEVVRRAEGDSAREARAAIRAGPPEQRIRGREG
jgi:hypothetical protein